MAWKVRVDEYHPDGNPDPKVTTIATPALGPAVESALHQLGVAGERTGNFQITVEQKG